MATRNQSEFNKTNNERAQGQTLYCIYTCPIHKEKGTIETTSETIRKVECSNTIWQSNLHGHCRNSSFAIQQSTMRFIYSRWVYSVASTRSLCRTKGQCATNQDLRHNDQHKDPQLCSEIKILRSCASCGLNRKRTQGTQVWALSIGRTPWPNGSNPFLFFQGVELSDLHILCTAPSMSRPVVICCLPHVIHGISDLKMTSSTRDDGHRCGGHHSGLMDADPSV